MLVATAWSLKTGKRQSHPYESCSSLRLIGILIGMGEPREQRQSLLQAVYQDFTERTRRNSNSQPSDQ